MNSKGWRGRIVFRLLRFLQKLMSTKRRLKCFLPTASQMYNRSPAKGLPKPTLFNYGGMDPLTRLAAKTLLGKDEVDRISLIVLIALDAAKRSAANHALTNTLSEHLCAATILWSSRNNRSMYDRSNEGFQALAKAADRPTELLDLSTSEYTKIRTAVGYYLRALPLLEAGELVGSIQHARDLLYKSSAA